MRKKDETTRQRILEACWTLVHSKGFSAATTKRIAQEASVAEGTIFNYFPDKAGLLTALVLEKTGDVQNIFKDLHSTVGQGNLQETLVTTMVELIKFYEKLNWISSAIFLDVTVMKQTQLKLAEMEKGPQQAHVALEAYLVAEQGLGRIHVDQSPQILAALLLGAAHEHAFLNVITGRPVSDEERREFANSIVLALFD